MEALQPVNQRIMPDVVVNGFFHLISYRTIVCHFGKNAGLEFFYGHILWRLGPVYSYFGFIGSRLGRSNRIS